MPWLNEDGLKRLWAHIVALVDHKVEKVEGKGLSSNDYTHVEKNKLENMEATIHQAVMDSQADYTVADETHPSFIKNKPDISGMIRESAENIYQQIINLPEINVLTDETAGPLKSFFTSTIPVKLNINGNSYTVIGGFVSEAIPETYDTMWSGLGVRFDEHSSDFYNIAVRIDPSDLVISATASPIDKIALSTRIGDVDEKFLLRISENQRVTVTKVGETPVIKTLTTIEDIEEALPTPDWSANDTNSMSYIANRTHYDGEEIYLKDERQYSESVAISKLVLSQVGIKTARDGQGLLHENSFFKIILDDQEYVIRPQSTNITELLGITIEEIGASFSYKIDRRTSLYEVTANFVDPIVAQYALFEYGVYVLKTLGEKFIPDTIARKTDIKEAVNNLENQLAVRYISLIDSISGRTYYVSMKNGQLASEGVITSIEVTKLPDRLSYMLGDVLDITGMTVMATYEDGTTIELPLIQWENNVPITDDEITLLYKQGNNVVSTKFNIDLIPLEDFLIDFDYITNEDGTYSITDWKGTLNGEPSTEMVIPDSSYIRI